MQKATEHSTTDGSRRGLGRRALAAGIVALAPAAFANGAVARPVSPPDDLELIALCAQFDEIERRHYEVFLAETRRGDEDAADLALAAMADEHEPILDRIVELSPNTIEGASALAATLHNWMHGDFADGGTTDERLALALVEGLAKQSPNVRLLRFKHANPDAELLALGQKLFAAVRAMGECEMSGSELPSGLPDADVDAWSTRVSIELDDACLAVVGAPAAVTAEGRALKAAAAMQQLRLVFNGSGWPGTAEETAWGVLSEIAGDAYAPPAIPEHLLHNEPGRA